MKKLFFVFVINAVFGLMSCAQKPDEVIGINDKGVFKITASLEELKKEWHNLLITQKNEAVLESFEIFCGKYENTAEAYYCLIARNKENTTKMASLLILKEGNFYLPQENDFTSAGTITCTGCSYGCDPERIGKKWHCNPHCGTNCTKSITQTIQ